MLLQPVEREMLATLQDFGLVDTFRSLYPDETERYSWFDYRSKGFNDNRGLRIDVILASQSMAQSASSLNMLRSRALEKPSNAPIFAEFE